jgi:hypothetical protein
MKPNESPCEDEVRNTRQRQHDPVDSDWPGIETVLAHPGGREWNQRARIEDGG